MGLQSLPVAFGVDTAKWICVLSIDITQLAVAAYLAWGLDEPVYAAVLLALVLPQVCLFGWLAGWLGCCSGGLPGMGPGRARLCRGAAGAGAAAGAPFVLGCWVGWLAGWGLM